MSLTRLRNFLRFSSTDLGTIYIIFFWLFFSLIFVKREAILFFSDFYLFIKDLEIRFSFSYGLPLILCKYFDLTE